ncbi:hypothetical protein EBR25_05295 [bacterium]|nr:hypothetical protein [bacterium]
MFSYSVEDAVECFQNAKNINAAIKKIIKSDAAKDPSTLRFVKAFKSAIKYQKQEALTAFLESAFGEYDQHLFLVLRNSYSSLFEPVIDEIISEYADRFNETYEIDYSTNTISITVENEFKDLGQKAIEQLVAKISNADLPVNGFMKEATLYALFEPLVLEELAKRVSVD